MAADRDKLSAMVNNLDSEINRSTGIYQTSRGQPSNDSFDPMLLMGIQDDMKQSISVQQMQADEVARSVRLLKAENKELGQKQEELIRQNQLLVDKATRMNENLKKMKYNDAMVSKANMSVNQLNRDISSIEGNLNKLNEEGKKARQQLEDRETAMQKMNNSRNNDMQSDLKLKHAEQLNKQLGDELRALNSKI